MYRSESLKSIGPALLKAQTLMGGALKGSVNPYFKSKYADLGSVLEACKELLNANGIIILQPHGKNELGTYVETTLLHAESGEFLSSVTPVIFSKEGDPQAQGSAITYARRYGLQSLLSMPAEDDDGEKAMIRTTNSKPKPEPGKVPELKAGLVSVTTTPLESATVETPTVKPRTTFRKPTVPAAVVEAKPTLNGATAPTGNPDDLGLN